MGLVLECDWGLEVGVGFGVDGLRGVVGLGVWVEFGGGGWGWFRSVAGVWRWGLEVGFGSGGGVGLGVGQTVLGGARVQVQL